MENEKFDVVIVGAGVAGALLAHKLKKLRPRCSILVLDAGDGDPSHRLRYRDIFALALHRDSVSPYKRLASTEFAPQPVGRGPGSEELHLIQGGPDTWKSNYARMVGGSTWAWRGNVPRFVPNDFELKKKYGVGEDWPITYEKLEPYMTEAEDELGVAGDASEWDPATQGPRSKPFPLKPIAQAYGDQVLKKLLHGKSVAGRQIRVVATPQARVSEPSYSIHGLPRSRCEGNASCIPICPSGAKYDASVHLTLAKQHGVEVRGGCAVTRVLVNTFGAVTGVTCRDLHKDARKDVTIDARTVILAGNAIETPRLWLHSRLDNSADLVGRNLMDHLQYDVVCVMNEPIWPYRGPQNTSSITSFYDHSERSRFSSFNISVGNDGWGRYVDADRRAHGATDVFERLLWDRSTARVSRFGENLVKALAKDRETVFTPKYSEAALTYRLRLSFSTEQLPDPANRVTLGDEFDALGVPRPKISFKVSPYSVQSLGMARTTCRGIIRAAGLVPVGDDEAALAYSGASHLMGTCRMGSSRMNSVVDVDGRSWSHHGLWVVGSSVFVTGSCVNPTLNLAALTLRTAEQLAGTLNC